MSARSKITEAALKAGFVNKASESDQKYYSVDEWSEGRKYIRVCFDVTGRVRAASWGTGRKSGNFVGAKLAEQVLAKLSA